MPQRHLDPRELAQRTLHRRGMEAVNWGIPVVNSNRMLDALIDAGGDVNQIVIMPQLQNWKNQTLTPNPDVIYLMPFIDTRTAGPMVLEIPPADEGSITGTITDWWQSALEDVGPAGVDKGSGGKYLILPPTYTDAIPEGFIVLPSYTFLNQALLRSIVTDGSDEAQSRATAYGKRIQLYPLSMAANPPATIFVDVSDTEFDATIPYDLRFFQSLDRTIQNEPWLPRDKAMMDLIESIGIAKGKTFAPDEQAQAILIEAAQEAQAWFNARFETEFPPYYDGKQWVVVAPPDMMDTQGSFYEAPGKYTVDDRGLMYFYAFSSGKHLGTGQFYLFTIRDSQGQPLDGSKTYRLTVPPNVPASQYWSAVAYDRATHTLVREAPWCSRGSQTPGIQSHADGSIELTFASEPPAGQEANWVPTNVSGRFEACLRFYGPRPSLYDKTWVLPDVEPA